MFAAANSVFGRWDDSKGEENIDFMPTILSRFDTIFIVKDEHNERRDMVSKLSCPFAAVKRCLLTKSYLFRRWPNT